MIVAVEVSLPLGGLAHYTKGVGGAVHVVCHHVLGVKENHVDLTKRWEVTLAVKSRTPLP